MQLRHLIASIVVLAASNGPLLTISNFSFKAASLTARRGACVTDIACAAGRSIA